jgi:hypothetical protein
LDTRSFSGLISGDQLAGKNAAIYWIKINATGLPFGLQIHQSNFNFFVPNSRHEKQKSSYIIVIRSEPRDTWLPEEKIAASQLNSI